MAIALALISALAYGVSDFLGGLASRRWDSNLVGFGAQSVAVLTGVVAVLIDPGHGASLRALGWGAFAGVGSALGILSLYRGLSRGSVSVVAPVSGVVTTVLPALVGIALLGNALSAPELIGIILTLPAVALVSREDVDGEAGASASGLIDGIGAGVGFGLLFVALDRAGLRNGAWPLLAAQCVGLLIMARTVGNPRTAAATVAPPLLAFCLAIGVLGGGANLLYLIALRHGELAIVGVLSSLYPAGTVLMARVWLHERWNRLQIVGMITAIIAVVLVAVA